MTDEMEWFVNREKQFGGFQQMVERKTKRVVMLIEAPQDMGKTYLLRKMRRLCKERALPFVYVNFRPPHRGYDYLELILRTREAIGASHFVTTWQTIQNPIPIRVELGRHGTEAEPDQPAAAAPGSIQTGGGTFISGGVQLGSSSTFVGRDQFVITAGQDIEDLRSNPVARARINEAFFEDLKALLLKQPVVFLFDSCEHLSIQPTTLPGEEIWTTKEGVEWLRDGLLRKMGDGALNGAIVIIAGRETPPLIHEDVEPLVAKTGLDPFEADHVREFLGLRNVTDLDIDEALTTSGGAPGRLAKLADLALMDSVDDDEWLN